MKILVCGDIVGRSGREVIEKFLPEDCSISYIDRPTYYSECGFIGYNLKKYSTPTLTFPKNHFLLAQEGDEVLDQRLSLKKFKESKIDSSKNGNHQFENFEDKIEQIFDFLL